MAGCFSAPPREGTPAAARRAHLGGRVHLKQAAREDGGRRKVLQLVELGHGGAQAQHDVPRVELGVREVGRQLSGPLRVVRARLAPHLAAQPDAVLPARVQRCLIRLKLPRAMTWKAHHQHAERPAHPSCNTVQVCWAQPEKSAWRRLGVQ